MILLVSAHSIDVNGSEQDCGADVDWNFLPSWNSMWSFILGLLLNLDHTYIHRVQMMKRLLVLSSSCSSDKDILPNFLVEIIDTMINPISLYCMKKRIEKFGDT